MQYMSEDKPSNTSGPFMTEEEYWADQRKRYHTGQKLERATENIADLAEEVKRLDIGLGEQAQATMALRDDMRQEIGLLRAQIHEIAKEMMALAMYVRQRDQKQEVAA